ncbi:MAG: GNAT family N-acetyltransferase [Anaerolineae bacterium]|nr:GNAT family N-acetyltransferase [Anaerolineae bacterium]
MLAGLAESSSARGLRPFNPLLDLHPTTELIELAFGDALDPLSREALREMRALAWLFGPLFWLLSAMRMPLADTYGGFVWMEKGRIVGNVTVHRRYSEKKGWFISNLAVHPEYRRRGIARGLVSAGVQMAQQKGARRISLEVRADNFAARRLYQELGFTEVDSVSSLKLDPVVTPSPVPLEGYTIEIVKPAQWKELLRLAEEALSPEAREMIPLSEEFLQPSLVRRLVSSIGDFLNGRTTMRLAASKQGEFAAVVTLRTGGFLGAHSLTLMVHPAHRSKVEEILLASALSVLETSRSRALKAEIHPSYPHARSMFEQYGFVEEATLDLLTLRLENRQEA